jgi:hypothetical protein
MSDDKNDYDVGYKKPPKSTQFQPGQSGNPAGRPKGVKNLTTDLEEELSEKILVSEGGQQQQTTKQRAMIKSLFAKAMKGDVRASDVLIKLILGLEQARIADNKTDSMATEDLEILEAFKAKILLEHLSNAKESEND